MPVKLWHTCMLHVNCSNISKLSWVVLFQKSSEVEKILIHRLQRLRKSHLCMKYEFETIAETCFILELAVLSVRAEEQDHVRDKNCYPA